ncbi:4'-phosphopantetheinyl transferase family protein [Arthrobacter sp. VKM Ac-2550]|uniref:4'-phosphopantetheinyl transferase family protein n=1 Tax=Crystallibacter permensis TaxID=1938888 RepID=UPI0022274D7E|nr:4'-phosphopantetheinyl transferase superfamily protein [Arthrobacter sp. VKM Ac-2550]MCW2131476.1 4'-phosphopantetheinyl transferase EntD (siderophore biosynthesis) [Arthrobacter sp. VKM Ac-2550]
MRDLLPPGTYAAECFGDLLPDVVLPDEYAAVRTATAARRGEFHTVRALARRALAGLALEAHHRYEVHPLLPDARGAPIWPLGIVGSMTHTLDYRAAVVAKSSTYAAIGLDAESNRVLPPEVCEIICRPEEWSMIDALSRQEPSLPWSSVLFSAKESVYKAWYPLTGAWLDFDDVSVQIEHDPQTFQARLPAPASVGQASTIEELNGRWMATADLILTTAYVPSDIR